MGKIKFFGVALGLLGNIMIGRALNQLIQTDSCGGVAMPACPYAIPADRVVPVLIIVAAAVGRELADPGRAQEPTSR